MDINLLITRFIENKCTQEEKQLLFDQLSLPENEKLFKEALSSYMDKFEEGQYGNKPFEIDRIYNSLVSGIRLRETRKSEQLLLWKKIRVRRLIAGTISIAAVFCIAFILGSVFSHNRIKERPVQNVAGTFTEIKAPLGARSEILLDDGTEVILNAGSSIKFGRGYNTTDRNLSLEGEGYFKVARNIELPLVVDAGNINIRATGTEFNVKAYSDDGIIETTLVNGEVEISQKGDTDKEKVLLLEPSQKAIYALKTDQITLEKIKEIEPLAVKPVKINTDKLLVSPKTDVEQATAWTHNKLIIKRENLESLCTKLQRKYNVNFYFGNEEIKKYRFTGILLDETFQQVMDIIKLVAPIDYLLDGKTVILFSNKEQAEKYAKILNKNTN